MVMNTIIDGNIGNGGIYFYEHPATNPYISYSDFFNNQNGNFTGSPPQYLGQIVTLNAKGDSCDTYMNIFKDPLFYSTTGDSAYYLTAESPCIDAGNPTSLPNPDGTIVDIGAFYFHQYLFYLNPEELEFGNVGYGESLDLDLLLINNTADLITILDIGTTNPAFTTDFTLDDSLLTAGDTLELTVTFAPDDTVEYNATLFVYSSIDTLFATLSGEGIAAIISAEPESFGFFALELGMDSTLALLFQNTGSDILVFYELETSNPAFTIDFPAMSQPLLPGETSDTCWITFTPTQEI